MSWCCDRDHDTPQWFINEAEFEEHVENEHPDYADGAGLGMFKEWCCIRRLRDANVCPVCNCVPQRVEMTMPKQVDHTARVNTEAAIPTTMLSREADATKELIKHVGEHVKQVGFMSVDYLQDNDEGAEQASGHASGGAEDYRNFLNNGEWVNGNWIPANSELAAYLDPDYLPSPGVGDRLQEDIPPLPEDYDWQLVRGWATKISQGHDSQPPPGPPITPVLKRQAFRPPVS
jgi:hypothetical protein